MAITQVTTVTVDGVVIGLSDTIDDLIQAGEFTIANLMPYMIVGQKTIGDQFYASLSAGERNYSGSGGDTPSWFPVNNTGRLGPPTVEFQTKASVTLPHVAYGRNFLVHGTLNAGGEPQQIRADNMSASDLRVVTSIDYKKIYYDVEMASVVYNFDSPAGSATYYQTGSQGCVRTIDNDEDAQCFVYSIFGDDTDWYCIKDWMFPADDSANNGWHMSNSQSISGSFADTHSSLGTGYTNYTTTKTMFRWINNQSGAIYGGGNWNWNNSGHIVTVNGDIVQACDYSGSGVYAGGCYNIISGLDNALKQLANAGLKFKWNSTWYKPIAEGGIVTGYTDDMTEESEWDDIVDVTGNTVPITPPGPTPPPTPEGDDIDPNSFGGGSKLGGVDNIWLLTAQQLSDLHTAFNNNSDPNFEPLNSIISVLGLAISPLRIFGDDISTLTNITIKKADGTSWSSGVNGHICSSQVSSFGLTGNISIQRKYNNFLDYPPYASHEMFIPLCGWVPLPSCCIGRSLSVYYVPDIQTGGVRGLVLCDGCIVAEKYGILGANIPFTSNGHGLMLGGIISGGVQTLADFATAMGGLATGNAMTTVFGGANFFSDGFNMALAANQNRTSVIGQNQDRTGFSDGTYIRIKSVYQDVKIDPLFAHTIGYMCHESGKLSEFHGFTVCENPHVHISATSSEKEEIKKLLEQGVILPNGE